jgi:hypothetical protein
MMGLYAGTGLLLSLARGGEGSCRRGAGERERSLLGGEVERRQGGGEVERRLG